MYVEYKYVNCQNWNIMDILRQIKEWGVSAESKRQFDNSISKANFFFSLYIVASPEQRPTLLSIVDKISADQQLQSDSAECGPRNSKMCGVLNIKVKDDNNQMKDYRVAYVFDLMDTYNESSLKNRGIIVIEGLSELLKSTNTNNHFRQLYMKNSGVFSQAEFLDFFPDQEETVTDSVTYLTPRIADKSGQKKAILDKMLMLTKLAGFKSYIDNLDQTDTDFWGGRNVYLIMPNNGNNDILNTPSTYKVIKNAIRSNNRSRVIPRRDLLLEVIYKKPYRRFRKNFDYSIRVFRFSEFSQDNIHGLYIEIAYSNRILKNLDTIHDKIKELIHTPACIGTCWHSLIILSRIEASFKLLRKSKIIHQMV